MVGMVAAMKGFNGSQGTELAEVIVSKLHSAVNTITFALSARSRGTSCSAAAEPRRHCHPPRPRAARGSRAGGG